MTAQPQDVADEPVQVLDEKDQHNRSQSMNQALLKQDGAQHAKRLAALGISGDDYANYEPGPAGFRLLQTREYGGFWDPTNTIIQIYGTRSSHPIFAYHMCSHVKADFVYSAQR